MRTQVTIDSLSVQSLLKFLKRGKASFMPPHQSRTTPESSGRQKEKKQCQQLKAEEAVVETCLAEVRKRKNKKRERWINKESRQEHAV